MPVRTPPSTSQNSSDEPSWWRIRLVSPTGMRKNSTIASPSATTTVPAHMPREISCCSSAPSSAGGSCALTDTSRARKPIASEPPAGAPAKPASGGGPSAVTGARAASAREATAPVTAGEPGAPAAAEEDTALLRRASLCGLQAALGHPTLEPLHAAPRVHELLAPGVEGVAVGAHLHAQLRAGRPREEFVAARAVHARRHVVGMDARLHFAWAILDAPPSATRATPRSRRGPAVPP